ncbi:MAG: hypothetical protein RL526_399, partial [Actinomycetota bacterium]
MNFSEIKERLPEYSESQKRALVTISLLAIGFAC